MIDNWSCALACSGGATVCRSKRQSLAALASSKAEFVTATAAAKTAKHRRSNLAEPGFEQMEPKPIHKENKPTTDIVAFQKPTSKQTRHVDVCFFAPQDWTNSMKDVPPMHTPGAVDPSQDLTKLLDRVLHEQHAGCQLLWMWCKNPKEEMCLKFLTPGQAR